MHVDVAVIGGGPAGLQAALALGRGHRPCVVFDSGEYRNATAGHMHNVLTRDGCPPDEFRAAAHADLAKYDTVTLRQEGVVQIAPGAECGFELELASGEALTVDAVILATGVLDVMPNIPGLMEAWGGRVINCPYCHGHEFTGQRIGVLGGRHGEHYRHLLTPIASEMVIFTQGQTAEGCEGLYVVTSEVTRVEQHADGLRVHLDDGGVEEVAALFVSWDDAQAAPFAEQLGLAMTDAGSVEIDPYGRTSVAGVYAAGDMASAAGMPRPVGAVVVAMAAGTVAAASANGDLASGKVDAAPGD